MSDLQSLYDQRLEDIKTTCNHREPKRVPVMGNSTVWPIAYAGAKTLDVIHDRELQAETLTRYLDDVYVDCLFTPSLAVQMKMVWALESKTYFISEDEVTIQHRANTPMLVEEYPEFIRDPVTFAINKLCPRKFPALQKSYPENLQALRKAAIGLVDFALDNAAIAKRLKENYGVPPIAGARLDPPLDLVFDRLRGFAGLTADMSRNPEMVVQACEALYPICMKVTEKAMTGAYPFPVTTAHVPTFLGPKKFAKFFWPTYKKMLLRVKELGSQTLLFMEGTWKPYFELMHDELPPNTLVALLECDDPIDAKKLIGDSITIIGGVPTSLLCYGTKQECLDAAKKILDACAPGGGFLWSNGRALLSAGDVKAENLIAVHQFVHDYGKY